MLLCLVFIYVCLSSWLVTQQGGSAGRTWLSWFPFPLPSGLLPREVLQVCPARRRSRGRPGGITFPLWPWNTSPSSLWTQLVELDEGQASFLTRAGPTWENGSEQLFGPNYTRGSPGVLVVKWAQSRSPLTQQPIKTFQK